MEFLTVNISGKAVQSTLYGRDYLVAPLTLIREGVLNGSQGPLFYPGDELSKDPTAWNSMPLVVYHPEKQNGRYPSARQPSVLNRQGIGQIFNAQYSDSLIAEGWFDIDHTKLTDERVYNALINNEPIELSTGVVTENEEAPEGSVFNTGTDQISYTHIARNYRPDHVAILPDQVGACSLKDGCGVFNARGVSHDDIRSELSTLLEKEFGKDGAMLWIETVFDNRVIYSNSEGLFLLGYSAPKGDIILDDDEPVEVKRVTTYQTVNGEGDLVGSSTNNFSKEEPKMAKTPEERKELIDGLIANSCCWESTDQAELDAMTDNQLDKTQAVSEKQIETEAALNKAQQKQSVQNVEPPTMTDEQWLAAAPEGVRNTLAKAEDAIAYVEKVQLEARQKLVDHITANVSDDAKPEKVAFLANKGIDELEQIASLMPKPEPTSNFFAGQVAAVQAVTNADPTFNRDDTFEAPELEFANNDEE